MPCGLILNAFRSGIFLIKQTKGKGLKILTPKQKLQRLPIALAQVKVGNTSENVLNKIRQIIYSLYQAKDNTKMNTVFLNSENSKISDPRRLLLNLTDKIDLRRKDKYTALSNLKVFTIHEKI